MTPLQNIEVRLNVSSSSPALATDPDLLHQSLIAPSLPQLETLSLDPVPSTSDYAILPTSLTESSKSYTPAKRLTPSKNNQSSPCLSIPSPFKKALHWPGEIQHDGKRKNKKEKVRVTILQQSKIRALPL